MRTTAALGRLGHGLRWALYTGRDGDLGPPLRWWRGPRWLKWILLGPVLITLGAYGFAGWDFYLDWGVWVPATLVALQLAPPLLAGPRPLTAVRLAGLGMLLSVVVVPLELPLPGPGSPVWPLEGQVLCYLPVLVSALARARPADLPGVPVLTVLLAVGAGLAQGPRVGEKTAIWAMLVAFGSITLGYTLNHRRQALESAGQADRAALDEREKRAALQERARIARELHDAIGHHLSMIAVRAESAPYRITGLGDPARDEFAALGDAARVALDETRQLVGVLREEGSEPEHAPPPTLADLTTLVASCRESGMDIRLTAAPAQLPPAIGLAGYRIVQEALNNARRHSPGAPVSVGVSPADGELRLTIHNGPPAARPVPSPGTGTGLAGIRERVTQLGGTCQAGPRGDGGYTVAVVLPVREEAG
ncbi:sensor histidine kinase [Amycolatopsis lurida]